MTKQCLHDLASIVTRIVSVSLSTGTVPSGLKQALETPILKKPGLGANDIRNFRPVVLKTLKKVTYLQLQSHVCVKEIT